MTELILAIVTIIAVVIFFSWLSGHGAERAERNRGMRRTSRHTSPSRRWLAARQVTLDVETTGLSATRGHRIIEIGCVEIIDRETTGRVFWRHVDPERDIDPGAFEVHGIGREKLRGKPKFADVADRLLEFVRDAEVLIHNAKFDLSFLDAELRRAGRAESFRECCRKVTDTLTMARRMFPGSSRRLDDLCDMLGVDRSGRTQHGALLDAKLLAQVYLRMTGGPPVSDFRKRAKPRRVAWPEPLQATGAERAKTEEITVQLSHAKVTGAPADVYPMTADELFKLYWKLAEKVREEHPDVSYDLVLATAMEATEETLKEMMEAGLAVPPAAGAWEQYEQRVWQYVERVQRREQQRGGKRLGGLQSGAEVRRAASYARTLVRRTKSRK